MQQKPNYQKELERILDKEGSREAHAFAFTAAARPAAAMVLEYLSRVFPDHGSVLQPRIYIRKRNTGNGEAEQKRFVEALRQSIPSRSARRPFARPPFMRRKRTGEDSGGRRPVPGLL